MTEKGKSDVYLAGPNLQKCARFLYVLWMAEPVSMEIAPSHIGVLARLGGKYLSLVKHKK